MSESNLHTVVGLFPVSFDVGNHKPGAQQLQLDLLVNTPRRTLSGTASVTQAINPPLDLQLQVAGEYTFLGLIPPTDARILVTLQGRKAGQGPAAQVVFKAQLVLEQDWQVGVASYSYEINGQWHSVENVPVKVDAKRIQEHGNVDQAARFHQATVEAAIAGGDLVQLKRLAGSTAGAALHSAIEQNKAAAGKPAKSAKA